MKRLVFAVLLVSTIAASAPQLLQTIREAVSMRGRSYRARRERQMGAFYPSIEAVLRATPAGEPLALIVPGNESRDVALFFDYYAYPRRTKIYLDSTYYGIDKNPPRTVVRIAETAALSTYGAMRLDDLRRTGALVRRPVLRDAGTRFVVPLAASLDGVFPTRYVVEATLASTKPAQVTFTFRPKNLVRTLTIGGEQRFDDLVYELFGVLDRGWLEVASTEPVRASFTLATYPVTLDELPIVREPPPERFRVPGGQTLWLVNLTPHAAALHINGSNEFVAPYDNTSRGYDCPCELEVVNAGARVYAFATGKQRDGSSRFFWPEAAR